MILEYRLDEDASPSTCNDKTTHFRNTQAGIPERASTVTPGTSSGPTPFRVSHFTVVSPRYWQLPQRRALATHIWATCRLSQSACESNRTISCRSIAYADHLALAENFDSILCHNDRDQMIVREWRRESQVGQMEANKREKVTRVGGRDKEARMVISLLITVWYYSFCRVPCFLLSVLLLLSEWL